MADNSQFSYTEEQYKQYCEFNLIIANGTIMEGLEMHFAIEDWTKKENLSQYVIDQMDKRMEQECEEEMRLDKREYLTIVKGK